MNTLRCMYVGKSGDVRRRIAEHRSGNVQASGLRLRIAKSAGIEVFRVPITAGTRAAVSRMDENFLSAFIKAGYFKTISCINAKFASELERYLIVRLNPLLNIHRVDWSRTLRPALERAFEQFEAAPLVPIDQLAASKGAGVYVFFHKDKPKVLAAAYRDA